MNEIAQFVGYAVMFAGGLSALAALLIMSACFISVGASFMGSELREAFDTAELRKAMRQLEAEGKVKRKGGQSNG